MEVEIASPFPAADVPRIWTWIEPFRWRVSDDFSPKTLAEFIEHWRAQESRVTTWGVYRAGELGGCITFEQSSPIVGSAHCVFKKSFWGPKTTVPAISEAVGQMFRNCGKLSLPVMEGNKAMISLLSKLGAEKEGILKDHTVRDGKPVSLVMMALFRESFAQKAAA